MFCECDGVSTLVNAKMIGVLDAGLEYWCEQCFYIICTCLEHSVCDSIWSRFFIGTRAILRYIYIINMNRCEKASENWGFQRRCWRSFRLCVDAGLTVSLSGPPPCEQTRGRPQCRAQSTKTPLVKKIDNRPPAQCILLATNLQIHRKSMFAPTAQQS